MAMRCLGNPGRITNMASITCTPASGNIVVTGDATRTKGTILTYAPNIPTAANSAVGTTWTCTGSGSQTKYYPAECRR
ncbi:pilin [Xanthomonas cannabis]|uniref:pilin n=1 Tax=Xanthomonas cannabis TaxID=1885674 RepID=UPI0030B8F943